MAEIAIQDADEHMQLDDSEETPALAAANVGKDVNEDENAPKERVKIASKTKPATTDAQQLPGTTPFPIARVSKIIKADKDVHMCQREAVFLISCATEHFIKRITDAAYTRARMEKRGKSVLYKDLAAVCSSDDGLLSEYFFLEDIIPKQTQTTLKTAAKPAKKSEKTTQ